MATWIPSWDALHPLVIHFPIGLLLIAPLFVLLGLIQPAKGRLFSVSALILMLLGTVAVFFAVATGEAAGELVDRTDQIAPVLEHHEELAETTRLVFSILTVLFAGILFGPALLKKTLARRSLTLLHGAFLIAYLAGCLLLVQTAHLGGRLVHEFGVHAIMGSPGDANPELTQAPADSDAS